MLTPGEIEYIQKSVAASRAGLCNARNSVDHIDLLLLHIKQLETECEKYKAALDRERTKPHTCQCSECEP